MTKMANVPPHLRMAYRILRNADYVPEEVDFLAEYITFCFCILFFVIYELKQLLTNWVVRSYGYHLFCNVSGLR